MTAGHGGRSGRYDAWREEAFVLAWIVTTAARAREHLSRICAMTMPVWGGFRDADPG